VVIGFEPQAITVQKNETFSVSLTIGNIPSDPGMAGIEFVVVWNSSFLNGVNMTDVVFHTSTPQSEQDNIWEIENIVNTSYAFYAYTWHDLYRAQENGYSSISGNQTVATITLKAIATGNTSLSVYVVEISSAEQERLVYVNPTWPEPQKSDLNFYLVDCEVKIKTMKADINGDGVVDIFDALLMARSFGSVRNDSNWNPDCDLNNDGVIDIFDVILLARNFGKTVPP